MQRRQKLERMDLRSGDGRAEDSRVERDRELVSEGLGAGAHATDRFRLAGRGCGATRRERIACDDVEEAERAAARRELIVERAGKIKRRPRDESACPLRGERARRGNTRR